MDPNAIISRFDLERGDRKRANDECVARGGARGTGDGTHGPVHDIPPAFVCAQVPLASIADEYIIPPTCPDFLAYHTEHEPEASGSNGMDLTEIQFYPPGRPVPAPTLNCLDVQEGIKDGLLPPGLPVWKEEDTGYPSAAEQAFTQLEKPLLSPISLLAQPRHSGPPALFFSIRGGHSTAIAAAREEEAEAVGTTACHPKTVMTQRQALPAHASPSLPRPFRPSKDSGVAPADGGSDPVALLPSSLAPAPLPHLRSKLTT
ncbi:hypothetical protein B0H14DRAFT_3447871 [Mycena olivaceomarginata]|nr:hypothetical protein B0H14DRAFT_3447871 [Mycena olivaceomarginata]